MVGLDKSLREAVVNAQSFLRTRVDVLNVCICQKQIYGYGKDIFVEKACVVEYLDVRFSVRGY